MSTGHRPSILAAAVLLAATATSARAASVLTTSLIKVSPNGLCCDVLNAGSKDVSIKAQSFDEGGNPVSTQDVLTLAPGTGSWHCAGGLNTTAYCRFEVTSGSVKALRASACIPDASDVCIATEPAR